MHRRYIDTMQVYGTSCTPTCVTHARPHTGYGRLVTLRVIGGLLKKGRDEQGEEESNSS